MLQDAVEHGGNKCLSVVNIHSFDSKSTRSAAQRLEADGSTHWLYLLKFISNGRKLMLTTTQHFEKNLDLSVVPMACLVLVNVAQVGRQLDCTPGLSNAPRQMWPAVGENHHLLHDLSRLLCWTVVMNL